MTQILATTEGLEFSYRMILDMASSRSYIKFPLQIPLKNTDLIYNMMNNYLYIKLCGLQSIIKMIFSKIRKYFQLGQEPFL
jgi:hypothetical protein